MQNRLRYKKLFFFTGLLLWVCVANSAQKQSLHEMTDKKLAPDFVLKDIDGNEHRLSNYRGKVVLVNFWATWCPPCRDEMPSMDRAYKKFKKAGMVILAIDIGEDEDDIFKFTADYPVSFPLLMDKDSSVIRQWAVTALPTTYIVDPAGRLFYRAVGGREWDDDALITQLMSLQKK